MLNRNKTGLQIFDDFDTDYHLPKFKKMTDTVQMVESMPMEVQGDRIEFGSDPFDNMLSLAMASPRGGSGFDGPPPAKESRFKVWLKKVFKNAIPEPKPKISVQQFFQVIKDSLEAPDVYEDKVNSYLKTAYHAKSMGQIALFEEIKKDVTIVRLEALLLGSNFKTRITEEQIVKFYKESERGLQLHFVKNFTRIIPSEVLKVKQKADDLKVFDNYVVLYYDLGAKVFKETEADVRKRKDPILFGVIKGTRNLYYIADWIDEFCDLTLKTLIDKFGDDAIKANDITVNYKK